MSASTLMNKPAPAIHVVSPEACKTTVILQAIPENTMVVSPRRAAPASNPPAFDYFNPSGNRQAPDILQERAALERIVHAFSRSCYD